MENKKENTNHSMKKADVGVRPSIVFKEPHQRKSNKKSTGYVVYYIDILSHY